VRLPHEVARLVVEGGVQEEPFMSESERLLWWLWEALTERYELLAFREGADGDSPFFESSWHA
jgi:hypothetical protein